MQRKASAVWKGGLKDGKGTVSAPAEFSRTRHIRSPRVLKTPRGTNPEELIAAAHAACFSMALSAQLGGANLTPESISTSATLTMEKLDSGWTITAVHLDVVAESPGRKRGRLQHGGAECQGRMPSVEGPEREDHDECEAGKLDSGFGL